LFVSISSFKYYLSFSDELIPERAEGRKPDGAVSLVAGGRAKEKREGGVVFPGARAKSLHSFLLPSSARERDRERELARSSRGWRALPLRARVAFRGSAMVLVDQVPSYPHAVSLPPPPPAIATAVLGVPTTSSSLGGGGGGGAATGIPAAPSTNRTAFLGAHLGVRASPLEAFVSTDPSDYAYGAERALVLLAVVLTVVVFLVEMEVHRKGKAEILWRTLPPCSQLSAFSHDSRPFAPMRKRHDRRSDGKRRSITGEGGTRA